MYEIRASVREMRHRRRLRGANALEIVILTAVAALTVVLGLRLLA